MADVWKGAFQKAWHSSRAGSLGAAAGGSAHRQAEAAAAGGWGSPAQQGRQARRLLMDCPASRWVREISAASLPEDMLNNKQSCQAKGNEVELTKALRAADKDGQSRGLIGAPHVHETLSESSYMTELIVC